MLKIPKQFQKIKITTEFKKFSHLKLGCALPYFFAPHSYLQLQKLLKWAVENDLKILPVGGASNILMKKPQNIAVILDKDLPQFLEFDNNNLQCSTNFNINFILMLSTFHNLGGLEFLAGIPANLGGIIKMNAGAYGKNISEFIDNVTVMQNDGELKKIPDSSIFFDYRYCSLDGFILKTKLKLKNDQNSRNKITEFLNRRKHSQPLQIPNLGCFFKNPPQCSAGKLIDEAGLKGYRVGDMQVSTKHANFLVNMGKATFLDAFKLIQIVKDRVYKQFSIELKPEVKVVQ